MGHDLTFGPDATIPLDSHREFLRALAHGLVRDEHRAEDLAQDAWLAAFRSPPRDASSARSFLATIVRRAAGRERRRDEERAARERLAAAAEAAPEAPDLELQRQLVEAVQGLRQPYRRAIWLRYYRDLSPPAIAELEGVPIATVKTRLRRALALLRDELDHRSGGDRSAWVRSLTALMVPLEARRSPRGLVAALALGLAAVGTALFLHTPTPQRDELAGSAALPPSPLAGPGVELAEARSPTPTAPGPRRAVGSVSPLTGDALAVRVTVLGPRARPLAGAELTARRFVRGVVEARDHRARSGADGVAELRLPADAAYRVTVERAGFAPLRRDLNLSFGSSPELVLEPGVVLTGRVLDERGEPVPGAEILRSSVLVDRYDSMEHGPPTLVARSDEQGRFTVDRLAPGPWRLAARTHERPERAVVGSTPPGDRGQVELVLPVGAEARGRIVGLPADAGAVRVVATPATPRASFGRRVVPRSWKGERAGEVARDGTFALSGLERGARYLVVGVRADGSPCTEVRAVASDDARADLRWTGAGSLSFQAVDLESGRALDRDALRVEVGRDDLWPFFRPADARREGGRLVCALPEWSRGQRLALRLSTPRHEPLVVEGIIATDGRPIPLGELALARAATIAVRVNAEGAPVAGALVVATELRDDDLRAGSPEDDPSRALGELLTDGDPLLLGAVWRRTAVTDATGVARFPRPARRFAVEVFAEGRAPLSRGPFEPAGATAEPLELVCELEYGASVRVRIVDLDGAPLPGLRVDRLAPTPLAGLSPVGPRCAESRRSDAGGAARFGALRSGEHRFRVVDEAIPGKWSLFEHWTGVDPAVWTSVTVGASGDAELVLTARRRAALSGVVRLAGEPMVGVELALFPLDDVREEDLSTFGRALRARSRADGTFRIDGAVEGEHVVFACSPERATTTCALVTVGPGGATLELELPTAVLAGRLLDGSGAPCSGELVRLSCAPYRAPAWPPTLDEPVVERSPLEGIGVGERVECRTAADGRFRFDGVRAGVGWHVESESGARSDRLVLTHGEERADVELRVD